MSVKKVTLSAGMLVLGILAPDFSPALQKTKADKQPLIILWEFDRVEVILSPDGKTMVCQLSARLPGHNEEATILLDLNSGKEIRKLPARSEVAFSPDAKILAVSNWAGFRLQDLVSGEQIVRFEAPYSVSGLAFSPDAKLLAGVMKSQSSEHECIHLWDTATGKLLRSFGQDYGTVYCLCFSEDGKCIACAHYIATGSSYKTAFPLCEVATGKEMGRIWSDIDGAWSSVELRQRLAQLRAASLGFSVRRSPAGRIALYPRPRVDRMKVSIEDQQVISLRDGLSDKELQRLELKDFLPIPDALVRGAHLTAHSKSVSEKPAGLDRF